MVKKERITLTKGWKSYAGAIILLVTGVYLIAIDKKVEGIQCIGLGLSILGIRHKLDRI